MDFGEVPEEEVVRRSRRARAMRGERGGWMELDEWITRWILGGGE